MLGRNKITAFSARKYIPLGTDGYNLSTPGTQPSAASTAFAQIASLLAEAIIPTRDGVLTVTSSATVDPITGSAVGANTANGRTLNVGPYSFPGAALIASRATTGVFGPMSNSSGLASNTTAAGIRPTDRTIVENTANSGHVADAGSVLLTDGVNYVISAEVRRGVGSRNVNLYLDRASTVRAGVIFDLDTLGMTNVVIGTGTVVRSSIRLLPNGNYLCQATVSSPAWGGNAFFVTRMTQGTTLSYTGDGVSSLIISGYQVELGEYATPPLAWDGSAGVSRLAQLNSWNQALSTTAGTVLAVGMPYGRSGTLGATNARLYDNVGTTGIGIYQPSTQVYDTRRVDSVPLQRAATSASTPAIAGQQKICTQRWDSSANTNRTTVDGVTTSSAVGTPPWAAATPIIIGNSVALTAEFDGWVGLLLFSRALTDAEVSLLTSNSYIA